VTKAVLDDHLVRDLLADHMSDGLARVMAEYEPATPAQLGRITLAGQQAMHAAITAVDIAFGYAGAGSVYAGHPLERCFRDIHTANQHIAFSGEAFSAYARARFV
jgi:hypothetical protein